MADESRHADDARLDEPRHQRTTGPVRPVRPARRRGPRRPGPRRPGPTTEPGRPRDLDRDATADRDDSPEPATADESRRAAGRPAAAPAASTSAAQQSAGSDSAAENAPLVTRDRAEQYASRWNEVKGMFVDEPRQAVQQADVLVGELLDELQALFRDQRQDIEQGLDTDETATEDLRLALRRYRSFFGRLSGRSAAIVATASATTTTGTARAAARTAVAARAEPSRGPGYGAPTNRLPVTACPSRLDAPAPMVAAGPSVVRRPGR